MRAAETLAKMLACTDRAPANLVSQIYVSDAIELELVRERHARLTMDDGLRANNLASASFDKTKLERHVGAVRNPTLMHAVGLLLRLVFGFSSKITR